MCRKNQLKKMRGHKSDRLLVGGSQRRERKSSEERTGVEHTTNTFWEPLSLSTRVIYAPWCGRAPHGTCTCWMTGWQRAPWQRKDAPHFVASCCIYSSVFKAEVLLRAITCVERGRMLPLLLRSSVTWTCWHLNKVFARSQFAEHSELSGKQFHARPRSLSTAILQLFTFDTFQQIFFE